MPIHPDRNVKPKDYKHLNEDELLVTSIFHTIQGEGPFGGYPACFVRLAGCNLGGKGVNGAGCEFCDTRFYFHEGQRQTFATIVNKIKEEIRAKTNVECNLVVLTGGEPMLQKNIVPFIKFLNTKGYNVQIESNGLLFQPGINKSIEVELPIKFTEEESERFASPIGNNAATTSFETMTTTLVVSPKLGGATKYPNLRPDVFERADCLKFVVEADPKGKYHHLPDYAFDFVKTGKPVYVSPINVYKRDTDIGEVTDFFDSSLFDYDVSAANYRYAAELAIRHGFILNLQKHIFTAIP